MDKRQCWQCPEVMSVLEVAATMPCDGLLSYDTVEFQRPFLPSKWSMALGDPSMFMMDQAAHQHTKPLHLGPGRHSHHYSIL